MKKRLLMITPPILVILTLMIVLWNATSIKAETPITVERDADNLEIKEEFMANPEKEGWQRLTTVEHASIPIGDGKTFNYGIGGTGPKPDSWNSDDGLLGGSAVGPGTITAMTPNIYIKKGKTVIGAVDGFETFPQGKIGQWSYDDGTKQYTDKLASNNIYESFGTDRNVVSDSEYYKKVMKNGMTAYMYRWYVTSEVADDRRGTYKYEKDLQLAHTMIMVGQKNGAVRVSFYVQNLPYLRQKNPLYNPDLNYKPNRIVAYLPSTVPNTKVLKNFALMGDLGSRVGQLTAYDRTNLYLIGDGRGIYGEAYTALGKVRVNYYLSGLPDSPENWSAGRSSGISRDVNTYFYDKSVNKTGFSNRLDSGYEDPVNAPGNGAAGTLAFRWQSGGSPFVFYKNQPLAEFRPGDIESFSMVYGLSVVSDGPSIYLDSDEFSFTKDDDNKVKITGVLTNGTTKTTKLYYKIDDGSFVPYNKDFSYPEPFTGYLGSELPFSLDLEGLSNEEHTITIYGESEEEPPVKQSEQVTAKIVYVDGEPTLTVDKKNGPVGQDFVVKGRVGNVIDSDPNNVIYYNPTDIFYKPEDAPDSDYKLATTILRATPDNSGEFEFTIPASEVPDQLNAEYKFSVRAKNRYDMITNVENIRLAKVHTKPTFAINDASKSQFLDNTIDSYNIVLENFKSADYPLSIHYKVDGETNWTKSIVSIETNDQSKKLIIPKEKLPFGSNHKVEIKILDKYGVESDIDQAEFNMPGKPVIETLDKENDFSMGVDYTVSGIVRLTDAYFPFTFYYKIGTGEYQRVETLMEAPDEMNGKFSFVIPKEQLPKGKKHSIEIKAQDRFTQESNALTLTLEGIRKSNVIVKFITNDSPAKSIAEDITFTQEIETTINLLEQKNVNDTLEKLKEKYTLLTSPSSEIIKFVEENTTLEYKFEGKLYIDSFPSVLNFSNTYVTKKFIEAEKPKYDVPLVIGDTRNIKKPWLLTVTLEKNLTSEKDPSEVLPRALWYKKNNGTKEMLYEGEALPIEIGTVSKIGEYNVSKNWDSNNSGFLINVHSNEIIEIGRYKASILWQVSATP